MKKLNVAIIGQGRSGRDIHGAYFKSEKNELYQVVAIVEWDAERRERAKEEYPGCTVYENYQDLYQRDDIDLVINASYSCDHYSVAKDLLEHGKNVVTEKPFARNRYECDRLIQTAKEKDVVLAVYQNSFFATFYEETKKLIEKGTIGEMKQINIRYSGFARRWDWQTSQVKMGGNLYNTGPHPVGLALGFLDFDENYQVAFSKLGKTEFSSGDSDDYVKIILTAPGKPVIDVEINSDDAYTDYTVKLYGSRGTYKCTLNKYEMKYFVPEENKEQPLQLNFLEDENGLPVYCKEELVKHEEEGTYEGGPFDKGSPDFYRMVYEKITMDKPMSITPEHAAMIVSVIEEVHAKNVLPIKY